MEYPVGITFRKFILDQQKPPKEQVIAKLLIKVLDALKYVHENNIIHRNLRPENIYLLPNDTIKLANFGVNNFFKEVETSKIPVEHLYYTSPEMIQRENYSYPSDIWSFGVITSELISLKRPFEHTNSEELAKNICSSNPVFSKNDSNTLQSIVQSILNKDPFSRIGLKKIHKHPVFHDLEQKTESKLNEKIENLENEIYKQKERIQQLQKQNQDFDSFKKELIEKHQKSKNSNHMRNKYKILLKKPKH
jgi:serine/threonine protein kinase